MLKVAIVILSGAPTPSDRGKLAHALQTARTLQEAGDDVTIIFEGSGTRWVRRLMRPGHRYHSLFQSVQENVEGACAACATLYGVRRHVERSGIPLLDASEGHADLRQLIVSGYQIITF